jgi:hypothetical protein
MPAREKVSPTLREDLAIGAALFVLTTVGSLGIATAVIVRMPADYFVGKRGGAKTHWGWALLRNLFGALLVVLGAVLSIPGVPGQGLLTILVGVVLLDIPGKHAIERRLVARPAVRSALDRIRARFGRPPFEAPPPERFEHG